MSTRATYEFQQQYGTRVFFYIHHDGYEAGAAVYFWRAFKFPKKAAHDGLIEKFIRANDGAEFTGGREAHGDTDYHYEINLTDDALDPTLTVYRGLREPGRWAGIWCGPLWDFINTHVPTADWDGDFSPIFSDTPIGPATLPMVQAHRAAKAEELASYSARFPTMSGNISYLEHELKQFDAWLAEHQQQDA